MKRLFRHACATLAVLIVMSMFTVVNASAANGTTIDTTNAKYGFVTVNYTSNAKLKVGIQYGSEKVSYKNCPSGKDAIFSLEQGDGTYTISLCENISGTTYRVVTSKKVNAKIENAYAPYLIATTDVQFTSGDDVCKKAAALCKDAKTDMDKVTAIYNYIAGHYTYDTKLASDITSGKVSKYIPDTAATLNSNITSAQQTCFTAPSAVPENWPLCGQEPVPYPPGSFSHFFQEGSRNRWHHWHTGSAVSFFRSKNPYLRK